MEAVCAPRRSSATREAGDRAEPPPPAAAAPVRGRMEEKIAALRARQQRYQEALAALAESGATQVSLTDPDSRRMRKVGGGYNAQIAVDARHKLIAAAAVGNEPTDHGQLAACAGIGVETYLPRPKKGSAEAGGHFGRSSLPARPLPTPAAAPRAGLFRAKSSGSSAANPTSPMPARKPAGVAPQSAMHHGPLPALSRWAGEAVVEAMHARVAERPEAQRRLAAANESALRSLGERVE